MEVGRHQGGGLPLKRLQCVKFPVEIEALGHVVEAIDTLLMTPVEAVVEASTTRQLRWLRTLLDGYDRQVLHDALVGVARDGHNDAVKLLILEVIGAQIGSLDEDTMKTLTAAAVAAAEKGHLAVVEFLLEIELEREDEFDDEDESDDESDEDSEDEASHKAAWKVLDAAARTGHLSVVKLAMEFAPEDELLAFERSDALDLAIRGGYEDIAVFLLQPRMYTWKYAEALECAIDQEQHRIAEVLFQNFEDGNFLGDLARDGNMKAVTYLYNMGHDDPELVNSAFIEAASHGHTDIVAFLLGSGPIGAKAFDLAFEGAASAGAIDTFMLLYDQDRASRASLHAAFEKSPHASIVEFLYANECIPVETVVAAFQNAGRCGDVDCEAYQPNSDQLAILRLLCGCNSIPERIVNAVFAQASNAFETSVLKILCRDHRISEKEIGVAFLEGAKWGKSDLVEALFKAVPIPNDLAAKGLEKAAEWGSLDVVKLLQGQPAISAAAKQKALQGAADECQEEVVLYMCKHGEWSIELLHKVLTATGHNDVVGFIRRYFDLL
jgi:hypothetical protein